MSTPEEPPQLTRRQLRELRNTASTPIVSEPPAVDEPPAPAPAPRPRAAEPVVLAEPPAAPPASTTPTPSLTRREVRQRERLRTASVPVITAEVLAAAREGDLDERDASVSPSGEVKQQLDAGADTTVEPGVSHDESAVHDEPVVHAESVTEGEGEPEPSDESDAAREADSEREVVSETPEPRRLIAPALGSDILVPTEVDVPASFDQLLTRGSAATGALSMPNALILSQTPEGGSLVAPVTSTGELIITGTFALPDTYGSTGSVPGRSDGKDIDAVLIDGELPAASSPTPIAASAAVSTIKSADEIIKPPAPEKGSRLMVVLAITAGVLAVALAGVLILAIATGMF